MAQIGLGNPKKAKDLGNTQPGDGYPYRGNGMLQFTSRGSHKAMGIETGFDLEATPSNSKTPPSRSAWPPPNPGADCLPAADADDVALVTRRVNVGRNGLSIVGVVAIVLLFKIARRFNEGIPPSGVHRRANRRRRYRGNSCVGGTKPTGRRGGNAILRSAPGQIAKARTPTNSCWRWWLSADGWRRPAENSTLRSFGRCNSRPSICRVTVLPSLALPHDLARQLRLAGRFCLSKVAVYNRGSF